MKIRPVTVYIASIAGRQKALAECIESLLNQSYPVSAIHVYLNKVPRDSKWEQPVLNKKVHLYHSEDVLQSVEDGDIGDVGKFFWCDSWENIIFTCDDKLIYGKDYVKTMVNRVERYGGEVVCTMHGRLLKPHSTSYYWDPAEFYGCTMPQKEDKWIHELGTGVMALDASVIKEPIDLVKVFPYTNMTDIYWSMEMQRRGIPMLMVAHPMWMVAISKKFDNKKCISVICNKNDKFQTATVNAFKWILNTHPHGITND